MHKRLCGNKNISQKHSTLTQIYLRKKEILLPRKLVGFEKRKQVFYCRNVERISLVFQNINKNMRTSANVTQKWSQSECITQSSTEIIHAMLSFKNATWKWKKNSSTSK